MEFPTSNEESASSDEITTLRVSKELREKLKLISAFERTTVWAITTAALSAYCKRYEEETGQSLLTRSKAKDLIDE